MVATRIPPLVAALVAVILATFAARAQEAEWPQRNIRLIVNTAAGGAADTTSRIVTQKLTERLGWTIVIENQAGASGRLGVQNIARAVPDGYTFGILTASSNAITAALGMDLPYKPVESFAPVSLIGGSPYVLAVHPGTGINSLADLVARAKAKPGQLTNGTFGLESVGGMASVWLESLAGVRFNSIPYRSTAQAVVDVVSGRIEMQFGTLPPTVALIKDGRIRGIGVTGRNRAAARLRPVTPMPRMRPSLISATVGGSVPNCISMRPETTSTTACAVERYGIELNRTPASDSSQTLAMPPTLSRPNVPLVS